MRKVFLYTTVLAGLCGVAIKAEARGLDVIVGGEINFQAGYADQKSAFKTGQYTRETKFANDTEVHVNVEGQVDNGVRYGAVIEMEADVNADARNEGLNADKTYIWLESAGGRIELGNNEGAEAAMAVNAATIARGTGGIDGDDEFYINLGGTPFLIHPDLPAADIGGIAEDATKVTYYTPDMNGVQMGISYTPDQGDGGTASGFTGNNSGDTQHVIGVGASYTGEYEGIGIKTSVVGEFGKSESALMEDTNAWQAGIVLSNQGFSLAGSYGDWGESGTLVGLNNSTDFWTLGAAYESGPVGVSATYISSEREKNKYSNLVVGADMQLAPGLTPYMEASFFDADQASTTVDNSGTVLMMGSYINF